MAKCIAPECKDGKVFGVEVCRRCKGTGVIMENKTKDDAYQRVLNMRIGSLKNPTLEYLNEFITQLELVTRQAREEMYWLEKKATLDTYHNVYGELTGE